MPRNVKFSSGQLWIADTELELPEFAQHETARGAAELPWRAERSAQHETASDGSITANAPLVPSVAAGPASCAFVTSQCFTSSAADYFVFLGARYAPGASASLAVRVGYADRADLGLTRRLAEAVLMGSVQGGPYMYGGTAEFTHARVHPVDLKPWAFACAAGLILQLLCTDLQARSDRELADFASRWWRETRPLSEAQRMEMWSEAWAGDPTG